MRFRFAAFFGVSAACAAALVAACFPDLITDAAPVEGGGVGLGPSGLYCGDGIVTLGQYDGGFADLEAGEQCDSKDDDAAVDAAIVGCSDDCHVQCEEGGVIDPLTNHCYFPLGSATSLNEGVGSAEQLCEAKSAHVVTLSEDRERMFVLGHFSSTVRVGTTVAFWIGLSLDLTRVALVPIDLDQLREPGWAPSCTGCYAPPNVADGSVPRLVFDAGGSCIIEVNATGWSQIPCSQIPAPGIPVLCEREPIGDLWEPCNGGICARLTENAATTRYLFSPAASTAEQARSACADLGGSLVAFDSRQERETLFRSLIAHFERSNSVAPQEVWIGYSTNEAGVFAWDVDSGYRGSPWGESEPIAGGSSRAYAVLVNATFRALDYDVQLAHDDTDVPRPYICQY